MARYFIQLSYCGTRYNGWQKQPHVGTLTVQQEIETALATYLRQAIDVVGCGRTDTGVHARDYFAHFDTGLELDIPNTVYRLNKVLPNDIAIQAILPVKPDAHTRFDAISRSYQYHIHTAKSPFLPYSYYHIAKQLDIERLNQAADIITELTDFSTFCKFHTDVATMECQISQSKWVQHGDHYTYYVTANRFLRGMIRLIVGMCLNVEKGKLSIEDVQTAALSKVRTGHDLSVPAQGLILCDIKYPDHIFIE